MADFLYGLLRNAQGIEIMQADETAVLPCGRSGGEIGAVMGAPAFLPLRGGAGDQNGAEEQVAQFTPGDGIGEGRDALPYGAGTLRFQSGEESERSIQTGGVARQPHMVVHSAA